MLRTSQVSLGDVEIAYWEVPGDGIPFVLLHGLTGHRDDFLPALAPLADRHPGLRLLVPDLRGHGDSTHGEDAARFSFAQLVADLRTFLDGVGAARVHLLGHSFGGMLALRFALAHPARLRSLLLASTAPFAPPDYDDALFARGGEIARSRGMAFLQRVIEARARSTPSTRPSDLQTERWHDSYWPHHRHRIRSMDPLAYQELGFAMVRQASVEGRLGEIAMPVSVIVGSDDERFVAGSRAIARAISGARLVPIENAGHHPHREQPEAWLTAVSAHLEARAASGPQS